MYFNQHVEEWRWLMLFAAITAATVAAAFWANDLFGVPTSHIFSSEFDKLAIVAPITIIAAAVVMTVRGALLGIQSPISACKPFFRERFGSPALAAGTLLPLVLTPFLMGSFGVLKQVMPQLRPFTWDDDLAEFGRMLFGGTRPWHFTHAIFGSPIATLILDRIYTGWIPLMFVVLFAVAAFAPRDLRARFYVAYAGAWILLGLAAAYIFSSAGPCFAEKLGSQSAKDFGQLMQRLGAIDAAGYKLGAVEWQRVLWAEESHHRYGFGLGISAMPSMHNAISFLYVLAAARARMWVRLATWAFALTILVGSVHLGWHYLADGIFAWAGMAAIWWGAGHFVRYCGFRSANSSDPECQRLADNDSVAIEALAA